MMQRRTSSLAILVAITTIACSDEDGPGFIPDPTPNNEGSVVIDGDAIVGETLEAEVSDDDGTPDFIAYQWMADNADIADATSSEYIITEEVLGRTITVRANYQDVAGFLETVTSTPTAEVVLPNEAGSIVISGVPALNRTLTAVLTDGNGVSGPVAYQWLADDEEIAGADAQTFVLTQAQVDVLMTVRGTYVDDDGFSESVVSEVVGPVTATVTNVLGVVEVSGQTLVGQVLTATVSDSNGISAEVAFQWRADGVDIPGQTSTTYTLTAGERGALVSATASYLDDDGFQETVTSSAADVVYSVLVTGEESLRAALAAAEVGDVIGLEDPAGEEDYADMAELNIETDGITVRRTVESDAAISGATCFVVSSDDVVVERLRFENLAWLGGTLCESNGDASVVLLGSGIQLQHNEFSGEASPRTGPPDDDPFHYLALKGVGNLVQRNLFEGKDMDLEGSAITIFASRTEMSNERHTLQYNLFRDMPGSAPPNAGNRNSSAHAIQVGRTRGADAQADGFFTIQYNRFEDVQSERRLMRVQSSRNTIHGNTVVRSFGMIALEDGFNNTVTQNVILSSGTDGDDGGISFAPIGHVVTDNYINNIRTTSSQRGALFINSETLGAAHVGNANILDTEGLDFTVTVARNTVVNARQAIAFEDASCSVFQAILSFENNLVFNQSTAMSVNENENGNSRTAVIDEDFNMASCAVDASSVFNNNHFYSATLSETGLFDFNDATDNNVVGPQDGTTFTQDARDLVSAAGDSAGVGVNTTILNVITASQVGPGSTWVAP